MLCDFSKKNRAASLVYRMLCSFVMMVVPGMCEVVVTNQGPVRGKLVEDLGVRYYSYQGIPYAESPIGDLRFMPPVPKSAWSEILDATKTKPVCPQPEGTYKKEQMSEDCLFLNVYVPAKESKDLLPVLAYVHGGEMQSQSGNEFMFGPQFFMQRDVIVVTCDYRLGPLGFLSLGLEEAAGNAGIKDALLALKWVQENIERFKGDPKQVTLGGNSAGSAIAHYMTLSDRSTGLFQRAILVSGSALGYRFRSRHPEEVAFKLVKELGIQYKDEYDALQKLKEVDAFDIIDATKSLGENDLRHGIRTFAPFVACIEKKSSHAIITEDPMKIIMKGIPQNVPILLGFNAREGIKMLPFILKDPTLLDRWNMNFEVFIPTDIEYPYGSEQSKNLASAIRKFYFNNEDITNKTYEGFISLIGDTQFSYAVDKWIRLHKERKSSNAMFYYVFDYDGGLNWFKILNDIDYPGASHADDQGYQFVTNATKSRLDNMDERDRRMVDVMMTYWSNFIKFGNPSPDESSYYTKWPETTAERNYLLLDDNPQSISSGPIARNVQFWDNVYEEYNAYLRNGCQIIKKVIP